MLCKEYWKEGRRYNKSVSIFETRNNCACTRYTNAGLYRLLEIHSVLQSVNSLKDSDSDHYRSLVSKYEGLVDVIRDDHIAAAKSHIQDETIASKLANDIETECKEIREYRLAVERWHLEIDSRSKDRLVSFGEKLSCRFVAALLQDRVGHAKSFQLLGTYNNF